MRVYFSQWISGVLIDQAGGAVLSEDLQIGLLCSSKSSGGAYQEPWCMVSVICEGCPN